VKLFGVDIAKEVAKAIKATDVSSIVLRRYVAGVRAPDSQAAGRNRSYTTHETRGVMTDYTLREIASAPQIEAGDKRVLMLAEPLGDTVPHVGDEVVIESATLRIVAITRDPAIATYECQCRG
jgi:hypothetical protein